MEMFTFKNSTFISSSRELFGWLSLGLCLAIILRSLGRASFSRLRNIPGPFVARFSRIWYLNHVAKGNFHKTNIELHRKHGPVVRIAPNQFSIDDPAAVKIIYGLGKGFVKSSWYNASAPPAATFRDLFTDLDPVRHSSNRRLVANLYSTTSLRSMEDTVDECIDILLTRIKELAHANSMFDLQFWMQSYAIDVVGQITLGKRFGFTDRGVDNDNLFANLHSYLRYCAVIGVVNELHAPLTWLMSKLPATGISYVAQFTLEQIKKGREERSRAGGSKTGLDFLSKTLEINEKNPDKFPFSAIETTCNTNIGAGSDTTAISLCSILFNIFSHPEALQKLRREVDDKLAALGRTQSIPFKETQGMPYFQACIKEALRLHPATGLPLARVVPEGGTTISGIYFPAGTVVGINSWVAHINPKIFGPDPEAFRPERWLDQDKDKLSMMESYWMPFGSGSRTCIGKNISLLEINKLVPVLVNGFDFSFLEPEKITHDNVWLVKQENMLCRASQRVESLHQNS